jgi:thioredoxin reductase
MPAWDYDLISIGGGPVGLTAGSYAGWAPVSKLCFRKSSSTVAR